jgi:hypothetical protein
MRGRRGYWHGAPGFPPVSDSAPPSGPEPWRNCRRLTALWVCISSVISSVPKVRTPPRYPTDLGGGFRFDDFLTKGRCDPFLNFGKLVASQASIAATRSSSRPRRPRRGRPRENRGVSTGALAFPGRPGGSLGERRSHYKRRAIFVVPCANEAGDPHDTTRGIIVERMETEDIVIAALVGALILGLD